MRLNETVDSFHAHCRSFLSDQGRSKYHHEVRISAYHACNYGRYDYVGHVT